MFNAFKPKIKRISCWLVLIQIAIESVKSNEILLFFYEKYIIMLYVFNTIPNLVLNVDIIYHLVCIKEHIIQLSAFIILYWKKLSRWTNTNNRSKFIINAFDAIVTGNKNGSSTCSVFFASMPFVINRHTADIFMNEQTLV